MARVPANSLLNIVASAHAFNRASMHVNARSDSSELVLRQYLSAGWHKWAET